MKPWLFLDVDGPLNPYAAGRGRLPGGYALHRLRPTHWPDDLPDLPVMRRCGCPIAVADAAPEVRAAAKYVTSAAGGFGAVRDAIEWLCKQMNLWDQVVARYQ